MIRKKQIHIISLTLLGSFLLVGFQNCSPLKFSPVENIESMKLGVEVDEGVNDTADGNETQDAYSGACEILKTLSLPLTNVSAESDFLRSSSGVDLDVPASNRVDISNQAEHILISAADSVKLMNIAGGVQVNANSILSIENAAGDICLRSLKIGRISNVSGGSKILGSVIDEVSNIGGVIHIYGALVNSVQNISGKVCLHEGARVLAQSNVSGFVGECP